MADNNSSTTHYNNLFSSLISDIKNYDGRDPLLPWLRGIRKMKESLPRQLLKEKLPRFLQKCSQTFLSDRRYSNDLRYLRVWLQLMDFVDDPKAVLQTMEANRIGMKKSLFYQAYALYYEKMKKFEAAEKMYHLGVQNLAEPTAELQSSFEEFIRRTERHKNRTIQRQGTIFNRTSLTDGKIPLNRDEIEENDENIPKAKVQHKGNSHKVASGSTQFKILNNQKKQTYPQSSKYRIPIKEVVKGEGELSSTSYEKRRITGGVGCKSNSKEIEMESEGCQKFSNDDTVLVRFVDTAIIGKSAAEDVLHHGLVEPTINTKEAMNAINSMFRESLEPSVAGRKNRNQLKTDQKLNNGLEVFVDDNSDHEAETAIMGKFAAEDARHHGLVEPTINTKEAMYAINRMFREPLEPSLAGRRSRNQMKTDKNLNSRLAVFVDEGSHHKVDSSHQNLEKQVVRSSVSETVQPSHQQFQIYIDDDENNDAAEIFTGNDELVQREVQDSLEGAHSSSGRSDSFVLRIPNDPPSEDSEDVDAIKPPESRFREDTVVYRFARSTISDQPEVENVCHHGLVEPTINMKEAMDDINSMFGKPLEFARKRRPRNQDKLPACTSNTGGFLILPDDSSHCQQGSSLPSSSTKRGNGLFEQTICTKEAMDEINNMFKMPLDF